MKVPDFSNSDNITEAKKQEILLKKTKEQLDLAVIGTGAGLWDWNVQTGKVEFNERWAEILGYTLKELAPVSIKTWEKLSHPGDLEESERLIKKHFAKETKYYICEVRMKHKDGRWISVMDRGKVNEWDKDGKPLRMTGTHIDITERKKFEEILKNSEEKYRRLVEKSHDIIYTLSVEGVFTYVSPVWTVFLGHAVEQVVGQHFQKYIHPDDLKACMAFLQKVIETGERQEGVEYRVKHLDGSWYWHTSSGVTSTDNDGKIICFEGVARDITKRKLLQHKELFTGNIIDILNSSLDLRKMIESIVAATKKETGFDSVGVRLKEGEDYPYYSQNGFSEEFLTAENSLIARNRNGGVCRDENGNISLECTCGLVLSGKADLNNSLFTKGGSAWTNNSLPILELTEKEDPRRNPRNRCIHDGYLSIALIPIRVDKEIFGLLQLNDKKQNRLTLEIIRFYESICSIIGVSLMRRQAEKNSREKDLRFEKLSSNVPGMIFQFTRRPDGTYCVPLTSSGIKDIYDCSPQDVREDFTPISRVICPDDIARVFNEIEYSAKHLTVFNCEYKVQIPGKNIRWVYARSTPEKLADGSITWYGFNSDITEMKILSESVNQTQKLESLGVIAGGISHDFNNLLTGIFGNIEMARLKIKDNPGALQNIDNALGAFRRAKDLTHQLLTFAKGGVPIKKTMELGPLLKRNVDFALSGSNVSAEFYIPENLSTCEIDENQIGQVIDNIVINALQAMPAGGTIFVKALDMILKKGDLPFEYAPGRYVMFEIKDQGIGIPANILKKIFDPFFTTKEKGSGLGLSTVYSVLKKHEGFVYSESEIGKGAAMRVFLPASKKKPQAAAEKRIDISAGGGRILLMDDEDLLLDLAKAVFEGWGHTVETAKNGEEALLAIKEAKTRGEHFSLVIFDLTISGGMGGKEAVQELRKFDKLTPVICSSGYSDDEVMSNPEKFGFSGKLPKPYSINQLSGLIEKI
ncbi:MAG: PAS domain-containing protein [Candidatus Firestonebacteria bacterium]|nr:PAS domain-containing protein [Candidatus Firestonebacteria bacterium]